MEEAFKTCASSSGGLAAYMSVCLPTCASSHAQLRAPTGIAASDWQRTPIVCLSLVRYWATLHQLSASCKYHVVTQSTYGLSAAVTDLVRCIPAVAHLFGYCNAWADHAYALQVVDFQWNPYDPWTFMSVSDDVSDELGGGTLQLWRVNDLIYREESEVLAELEKHRQVCFTLCVWDVLHWRDESELSVMVSPWVCIFLSLQPQTLSDPIRL